MLGEHSCSTNGDLNDSKFSEPLPWIGIYIAAASMACCAAMAADAILAFRHRKLWFPCKFFSLNATSLTLIAVAIKLSVDLNTSMPRREDQLAKLSSAVLICTIMGNSMPSLGTMDNTDLFMNIMALGILVITLVVNICIQLATGAIYLFWEEHACIIFLMLILFVILSFSAVVIPTTKLKLEYKYSKMNKLAEMECKGKKTNKPVFEKLKEDLMKNWMMAHTSSPQFVMGRSVTCTASGAFCLLSAAILAETMIRSYLMPWSLNFCGGESDYKRTTTAVLIIQAVAVGVGTIAPAFRWFTAINFRCPNRTNRRLFCKSNFRMESYWIQGLVELKECPLALRIHDRRIRKLAHAIKSQLLDFCIQVQMIIVCVSKAVQLISIVVVSRLLFCCDWCWKLKSSTSVSNKDSGFESQSGKNMDLSRFVLHLEGEEDLVELVMKKNCDATEHWIQNGKRKQLQHLIQILDKYASSNGFEGVREFDSDQVPSLYAEEPPNCWALPVVTLTSIAVALPNIDKCLTEQLLYGVNEGLTYVKLIENHLDAKGGITNIRKAGDLVWLGVDLHQKWLDVDLHKMKLQAKTPYETLDQLSNTAENRFKEFHYKNLNGCLKESPTKWPTKVIAANSLYRVCQTIMLKYRWEDYDNASEKLFEALSVTICKILLACLTNLRHVIPMECACSKIEERAERVRRAVLLLGKAEKILKILDQQALHSSDPDQMACIDKWHLLRNEDSSLTFNSSSENDTSSFSSSSLGLSIV